MMSYSVRWEQNHLCGKTSAASTDTRYLKQKGGKGGGPLNCLYYGKGLEAQR